MSRQFKGVLNRREAMGAAGVACVGAGVSCSPPYHDGPKTIATGNPASSKADAWRPQPEGAENIQTFGLNFTNDQDGQVVAKKLASTLKALGHHYPDEDLAAIGHNIVSHVRGDTCYEDGVLSYGWHRPHEGHLRVEVRLSRACEVSEIPRGWKSRLLG
jgi:hypothetical protein